MIFSYPEPVFAKTRIKPIFMPFSGCASRCVYCSQTAQTGKPEAQLENIYTTLQQDLAGLSPDSAVEVAFYGGTFTALPFSWQERFVGLAGGYIKSGVVTAVRCSTRPDAIEKANLLRLQELGLRTVELGVQSFNNTVLSNSKRGYDEKVIVSACNIVKNCGLTLGMQLLPGLPGMTGEIFRTDIQKSCEIAPDVMRLYPCLVFKHTVLANWYARGEYSPWTVEETVSRLGEGLLGLWEKGIRVIRIGVAQEDGLTDSLVAGPFHPAMGSMVRGEALRIFLGSKMDELRVLPSKLIIPQRYRGELWGYKGGYKDFWKQRGLSTDKVCWWNLPVFQLN